MAGPPANEAQAYLAAAPGTSDARRGEEIVAALCESANHDAGEYKEVIFLDHWLSRERREEPRYVAATAAQALTVAGKPPRADVAAAQASAATRVATAAEAAPVLNEFQLNLAHGPTQRL